MFTSSTKPTSYNPRTWLATARVNQLPPPGDEWRVWLILAGRGFGKTRAGAELVRAWVQAQGYRRIALIGQTEREIRDVMIEGPSGILMLSDPAESLKFDATRMLIRWPNGAIAQGFSADNYERLRGPQFDAAWIDELAKFRKDRHVWTQLSMGLRLGERPRIVVTTTPRPTKLIKELIARQDVIVTRGSTHENAQNLAPDFIQALTDQFAGTRMEAQEIFAEILPDMADEPLWTPSILVRQRRRAPHDLARIVIGVDPALSSHTASNETGIIVAAKDEQGQAYVLADLSERSSPSQWAQTVSAAYKAYEADTIVAEVNAGGDFVIDMLRTVDAHMSIKSVHARRGKWLRAEPIAALYEQGRVWHTREFYELESQLLRFSRDGYAATDSGSPDRADALVWALSELMLSPTSTSADVGYRGMWGG